MLNRHFREEPSEQDSPFVWINIRVKNMRREQRLMEGSPPTVTSTPDSWHMRRGGVPVEALNALAWLFIFTYLSAVQGLIHL